MGIIAFIVIFKEGAHRGGEKHRCDCFHANNTVFLCLVCFFYLSMGGRLRQSVSLSQEGVVFFLGLSFFPIEWTCPNPLIYNLWLWVAEYPSG